MTAADLPQDLAILEQALAQRPLPAPSAGLRPRALGELRCARARERRLLLATVAVVVIAVASIGLSTPLPERVDRPETAGLVRAEALALERLGYAAADAQRLAFVAHAVELPRLAPPMGSGAVTLAADGRP